MATYTIYDKESGTILYQVTGTLHDADLPEDRDFIAGHYSAHLYRVTNGSPELIPPSSLIDPLESPATLQQIKDWQLKQEQLPTPANVNGLLLDCDERSVNLMQGTLRTWDQRSVVPGVFEDIYLNNKITRVIFWKDANNINHPVTKELLTTLLQIIEVALAEHIQQIWATTQQFKTNGCTVRQLTDYPANWGI